MRRYRLKNRLVRTGGRLTVALGLAGFIVLSLGFPLWQPVESPRGKDASTPFPCQNRPCGCMSAEACYRGCCCLTAAERLAWAVAHQVEPPAELIAAAASEHPTGDGHLSGGKCCAKKPHAAEAAECAEHQHEHADDHDHDAAVAGYKVTFVIGAFAAECRGMGPLSTLTFSALPSVAAVSYTFDWCPTGWLIPDSLRASSCALPPPTRPPRA